MTAFLILFAASPRSWVLSLLVHPFGKCWLCRGGRRVRKSSRRAREVPRCARASAAASGSARAPSTGSAARWPPTGEASDEPPRQHAPPRPAGRARRRAPPRCSTGGGLILIAARRQLGEVATVVAWALMAAVVGAVIAAAVYVFLWLRHRVRHPETLAGRQVIRAEVLDQAAARRPSTGRAARRDRAAPRDSPALLRRRPGRGGRDYPQRDPRTVRGRHHRRAIMITLIIVGVVAF